MLTNHDGISWDIVGYLTINMTFKGLYENGLYHIYPPKTAYLGNTICTDLDIVDNSLFREYTSCGAMKMGYIHQKSGYREYDNESVDLGIPRSFRQAVIVMIPKSPELVIHDFDDFGYHHAIEHRNPNRSFNIGGNGLPGLVNVYVTMDKSPFSMGKSTISTGPFSIAKC